MKIPSEETFTCSICGFEYLLHDSYEIDDRLICSDCAEEHTVICQVCGERIRNPDNAGTDDIPLCQYCRDTYYLTCSRCGVLIHEDTAYYRNNDDDEPLCWDCHSEVRDESIHNYYYKPDPIFYGTAARYLGVELEIDGAGEYGSNAENLLDIANQNRELIYCKHDGSLNDGFEIVTHPMTLVFHQQEMPWKDVMEKAVSMGYRSHHAQTCGLHCHVNRDSFGETEQEQDYSIARVLYFVEKHWEELLKFSRRTQRQLERWAARYGYKERPMEILDEAKSGYGSGRYTSINLQNQNTVEFRIFRGSLKYNTLIATLQLVNQICDVAIALSDGEIQAMSWTTFVAGVTKAELIQYLKERRLYINEPIEKEEEI